MKIAIFSKGGKYLTYSELEQWSELLEIHNISCSINYCDDCDNSVIVNQQIKELGFDMYKDVTEVSIDTEFVISYGGDGTFLHSIDMFKKLNIPILGINSGRLGFLASVPRNEIEKAILAIKEKQYTVEERPLNKVKSDNFEGYFFNEFTIQKRSLGMIDVSLYINSGYVANYLADGLIISSPSGSTAYSMSVGGPIVAPECNCYIVNPIAPHNLNMRPLVISDNSFIELSGESRDNELLATMDNRSYKIENHTKFIIEKSKYKIKLVKLKNTTFFKTIREKLMWGIDSRQGNN